MGLGWWLGSGLGLELRARGRGRARVEVSREVPYQCLKSERPKRRRAPASRGKRGKTTSSTRKGVLRSMRLMLRLR